MDSDITADTAGGAAQTPTTTRPQRGSRIKLACSRCQKRKIKCDGHFPCSACKKAGAVCSSGTSARDRPLSKAYVNGLWSRIRWLEATLTQVSPSSDLSRAPQPPPEDDDTLVGLADQVTPSRRDSSDQQALYGQRPRHSPSHSLQRSTQNACDHHDDNDDDDDVDDSNSNSNNNNNDYENDSNKNNRNHVAITAAAATSVPEESEAAADDTGPQPEQQEQQQQQQPERVHDIGLVSLGVGQDLRYVGPSSGYVFAKLLLKIAGISSRRAEAAPTVPDDVLAAAQALRVSPAPLPTRIEDAELLCSAYWETIHPQYPFLHRPTHRKRLEHVYAASAPAAAKPLYRFQVFLVLAISATLLSYRLKTTALPAEGFAAAALEAWEQLPAGAAGSPAGSLEGLQSLLLLILYALYNPSSRLNAWYLNYQAVAAVLDLGLQRDVQPHHRGGQTATSLSRLTREMRTRIFWVVYTLDRTLATVLGRPVGLRDEACDLRLPADLDDDALLDPAARPRRPAAGVADQQPPPTPMTTAIHLFRLARLNSEIKYIGHSISHKTPSYCYPAVPDVLAWRADMARRLDEWAADLPAHCCSPTLARLLRLRYHEAKILLLRPSPAVPRATAADLRACHASAAASIAIHIDLYRTAVLSFSWLSVHALFLDAITMLYCLASLPDLADEIVNSAAGAGGSSSSSSNAVDSGLDALQDQMQAVSNILSAAAETWPDAKRSRDVLDDVAAWTLRLLRRAIASRGNNQMATSSSAPAAAPPLDALPGMTLPTQTLSHHHHHHHHHHHQQQQQQQQQQHQQQGAWAPFPPGPASPMPPMPPLSPLSQQQQGPDQQQQVLRPGNGFEVDRSYADLFSTLFPIDGGPSPIDEDLVMQGIFRDYQPIVDFDVGFDLGLHAGAGADLTNAG